jgi:hypothetical protein
MEYGNRPAAANIATRPGNPYTKKAPRQTGKRITSVERRSSGLVAGFFYTDGKGGRPRRDHGEKKRGEKSGDLQKSIFLFFSAVIANLRFVVAVLLQSQSEFMTGMAWRGL